MQHPKAYPKTLVQQEFFQFAQRGEFALVERFELLGLDQWFRYLTGFIEVGGALGAVLKKEACGATATTQIKCTEFNAGKFAPYVSDEVTLTIPVEAVKE